MQMGSKYIRNRYNNKTNWSRILYLLLAVSQSMAINTWSERSEIKEIQSA